MKIMIVEDEAITALNLKMELSEIGYEICELITTGGEAIKNVKKEKPNIVLMDINLNGNINGMEAAKEIRSTNDVPIIFFTGCEDDETMKLITDFGPAGYLIKPVEFDDLRISIERALQKHASDPE